MTLRAILVFQPNSPCESYWADTLRTANALTAIIVGSAQTCASQTQFTLYLAILASGCMY